jgi:hypothetical protein
MLDLTGSIRTQGPTNSRRPVGRFLKGPLGAPDLSSHGTALAHTNN